MWFIIWLAVTGFLHESHGSEVINLSRNNFTQFRQYKPVFMLLFSVDWCTNCVNMWPEYELAASELSKLDPPIPLAKINGVADEELVKQFGVTTFPTIFILNEELVHRYRGQLRAKYFIDEMKKEISQGYEIVNDLNEIDLKRTPDDTVLLALCKTLDHPIMKKFRRSLYVASNSFIPLASTSASLRERFGYNDSDFTVLILKPTRFTKSFQSPNVNVTKLYYNHSLTEVDIAQALAFEQLPLVGLFTEVTKKMYKENKDRLLCVIPYSISLYKAPNQVLHDLASKLFNTVVKEFKDKIHWVIVDDLKHSEFLDEFADPLATEEMTAGCKSGNQTYQLYGDQLNMEELKAFIAKMLIKLELNPPKAES
ncbi:hypothetical protein EG68_05570 [Paragonimus skrjabini miyazakii]|uniref:Thioredoxin domain-containing protein n=1 Tax=Paragonimus skrjabini miyazakii TaxID=59628 RepID=A0A8S9YS98_9TREM|nr:hypothetical protein EG68_05570 [Paragonimus skrjabini miyazakii]